MNKIMNKKVRKLWVVCLFVILGFNIYVVRRDTQIINRNDLFVQRYEEFERIEFEYTKTKGGYLNWKNSKEKKNLNVNLASKIRLVTLKHTTAKKITRRVTNKLETNLSSIRGAIAKLIKKIKTERTIRPDQHSKNDKNQIFAVTKRSYRENTHTTDSSIIFSNPSLTKSSSNETEKHTLKNNEAERSPVANVYYYGDLQSLICNPGTYDTYAIHWHPLFPEYPLKTELIYSLEDKSWLRDTNRKITGFLTPKEDNYYVFQLSCRDFCEFILIENYNLQTSNKSIDQFLHRFAINIETTKGIKLGPYVLYQMGSPIPVFLKKNVKYLFDITSLTNGQGMLKLRWRIKNKEQFEQIPSQVLQPLFTNSSLYPILPKIKYFAEKLNSKVLRDDAKNDFWKIHVLEDSSNVELCENYEMILPTPPKFDNETFFLANDMIYPPDKNIGFKDTADRFKKRFLDEKDVNEVVQQYLKVYVKSGYVLHRIVNVERSAYQLERFFIEIDVQKTSSFEIFRSSNWILKNSPVKNQTKMCRPPALKLKLKENIYLLTPVRNQRRWIAFLIKELNNLVHITGDRQLHLVIVDYDSTDCDVGKLLQDSIFNYTFIRQKGSFNKVKGLNVAVKVIKEEDPIIFVFDLQLQFPLFLFDHVRKHTFRRQMTNVPVLLRCACAQHPEYTEISSIWNIWMDIGFGMISLYKSDWLRVGGMDEIKYGKKWGGEDWDFAKRVLQNRMEMVHNRIPGYYHLFHDTRGTWDGTKLY